MNRHVDNITITVRCDVHGNSCGHFPTKNVQTLPDAIKIDQFSLIADNFRSAANDG